MRSTAALSVRKRYRELLEKLFYDFFQPILKNRRAVAGLIILIGFMLMATIGPALIPLDLTTRFEERFKPPSLKHPLGTDFGGRDTLAQIVHGSTDVLTIALLTALFASSIAVCLGTMSGYLGGAADFALMAATDIFLTIPAFPVQLMIAVTIRIRDPFSFAAVLSIWMWAGLARSIRAQVRSLTSRDFIEAAKVEGLSTSHIVFKELLPNILSYVAINFIRMISGAITASVGIMFPGVVPFSLTHWGVMLNIAMFQYGAVYVPQGIYYTLSPLLCIILLEFGAVNFGHGLDEVVNPRLRRYE